MNQLRKINPSNLRISYQSELLMLRQEITILRSKVKEMKQLINSGRATMYQRKITLSASGQHHFIALDDIIYCEADGNYTKVCIRQKNNSLTVLQTDLKTERSRNQRIILISKSIKSVVEIISSDDFVRCHQSYVVNRNYVKSFESKNGLFLHLSTEQRIPVSRRNKKKIMVLI